MKVARGTETPLGRGRVGPAQSETRENTGSMRPRYMEDQRRPLTDASPVECSGTFITGA